MSISKNGKIYHGLWKTESKSGGATFYKGENKDTVPEGAPRQWLHVFPSKTEPTIKNLVVSIEGQDGFQPVETLVYREGAHGEFFSGGKYLLSTNRFYKPGTKMPEFTLQEDPNYVPKNPVQQDEVTPL
jgi:hypothetical protein